MLQEPHDYDREVKLEFFACQRPNYKVEQNFFPNCKPSSNNMQSPVSFLTRVIFTDHVTKKLHKVLGYFTNENHVA